MQINNYNSNTSFGIRIPTNVRDKIINNIPKDRKPFIQNRILNDIKTHIKELEQTETNEYILGIKELPNSNNGEFILQTVVDSKLKATPLDIKDKRILLSRFFVIDKTAIRKAIENLKKI